MRIYDAKIKKFIQRALETGEVVQVRARSCFRHSIEINSGQGSILFPAQSIEINTGSKNQRIYKLFYPVNMS
jgi:hypothetical protein